SVRGSQAAGEHRSARGLDLVRDAAGDHPRAVIGPGGLIQAEGNAPVTIIREAGGVRRCRGDVTGQYSDRQRQYQAGNGWSDEGCFHAFHRFLVVAVMLPAAETTPTAFVSL